MFSHVDGSTGSEASARRCRTGSGNFCNGPWRVNPLECGDPVAGVLLLSGVGAVAAT